MPASNAPSTDRFALRALYETSQMLNTSLDLEFVLNNLLLIAMSKLFVTRGVVLLHDPVKQNYRFAAVKGIRAWEAGDELDLGDPPAENVELRGTAIPPMLAKERLGLLIPITYHDRHIGFLGIGHKVNGQPVAGPELEFIKSLVNISSAAVHNSLMVQELKQANRDLDAKIQELNTLFDLSQEFNATRDRKRLIRLFSFALMGQLLVQRHLFLLRKPGADDDNGANGVHEPMQVVASQGITADTLTDDIIQELSTLGHMVLVRETPAEELRELGTLGLNIIIPLSVRGRTQGVLGLGPKLTGQTYTQEDLEFLYALGNLALTSIQNTYLVEEQIEKERMTQEMRLARDIQQRLLPQDQLGCDTLDVAGYTTPSQDVGGDYFDMCTLENNRLMVAIADVTGKGMPASLLMANIQACLRVLLPLNLYLEEATARINGVIHQNTGFDKFITFFWGIYNAESRTFDYVNAGHDPPMHFAGNGTPQRLETGGLLLGVFGQSNYERGQITLGPGDVVAMFTDGVTEAMNPAHEEYGEERLQAVLEANLDEPAQGILDAVLEDVRTHTNGAPQSDDITMIVLKGL